MFATAQCNIVAQNLRRASFFLGTLTVVKGANPLDAGIAVGMIGLIYLDDLIININLNATYDININSIISYP